MRHRPLAERLQMALVDVDSQSAATPTVVSRILDAAARRFADVGVDRTTMSSIAAEADLSREWLYRHFSNRDAVVAAVVRRELRRFVHGLAVRATDHSSVVDAVTDAFVYTVEFLRDQRILAGIFDSDRDLDMAHAGVQANAGSLVGVAVRTVSGYLVDSGGFDATTATVVAETLTRLVGSTMLVPSAELDLHDPDILRMYAQRVVPAVVNGC